MTNLDSMLKGRDIALLTKVHLVKAMVFPVVMYGCELYLKLKVKEFMILNGRVGESPLDSKETQLVHLKGNQS